MEEARFRDIPGCGTRITLRITTLSPSGTLRATRLQTPLESNFAAKVTPSRGVNNQDPSFRELITGSRTGRRAASRTPKLIKVTKVVFYAILPLFVQFGCFLPLLLIHMAFHGHFEPLLHIYS